MEGAYELMHFWTVSQYELDYHDGALTAESVHMQEREDAEAHYQDIRQQLLKRHPNAVVKEEHYAGVDYDNLATVLSDPQNGSLVAEVQLSADRMLGEAKEGISE